MPFVRWAVFEEIGGFRALAIMDDDFVVRLRRWDRDGLPRTIARWVISQTLFSAGLPARWLVRLYPPVR